MILWFAGAPCTFRTLRPSEVRYEVCACSGRPLEKHATVQDPLNQGIHHAEHSRHAASMRTERTGPPLGGPMNCFSLTLPDSVETVAEKLKHANPCKQAAPRVH